MGAREFSQYVNLDPSEKRPAPEIIDAHVHLFPERLFKAIWEYFEAHYWRIEYKFQASEITSFLKQRGVSRFTALNYAHKPGISRDMNSWTRELAARDSRVLPFGTIHPGDEFLAEEVERVLARDGFDFYGLKLQILVTDFDPSTRALDPMYEALVKHGKILVMHVGTGPIANEHVGLEKLWPVLENYPNLRLQVPHLGCFEYEAFFDLAATYPNVYLDTAMILVQHDVFDEKFDRDTMLDALLEIQDKVMFGSDFPNIPYPYEKALESIWTLPVDEAVKAKILSGNARRFYRLGGSAGEGMLDGNDGNGIPGKNPR